jgi:hypothetical protein
MGRKSARSVPLASTDGKKISKECTTCQHGWEENQQGVYHLPAQMGRKPARNTPLTVFFISLPYQNLKNIIFVPNNS